ncbi:MAG: hypothetical protein ACRC4L_00305 [Mycoplasma sp.]
MTINKPVIFQINTNKRLIEQTFFNISSTKESFESLELIMNYIKNNLEEFNSDYDEISYATKLINLLKSNKNNLKIINENFEFDDEDGILDEEISQLNETSSYKIIINLYEKRIIFGVMSVYFDIEELLESKNIDSNKLEQFEKTIIKGNINHMCDSIIDFNNFDKFKNIITDLNNDKIVEIGSIYYESVK